MHQRVLSTGCDGALLITALADIAINDKTIASYIVAANDSIIRNWYDGLTCGAAAVLYASSRSHDCKCVSPFVQM